MTNWGFTLSSEELPPRRLVELGQRAEEVGFEFVSVSDHFHPWLSEQGNSPFVWSVVGGVAATTNRIRIGTGVTCPIMRIHPAIIAQAAATSAVLSDGRFFLGVGTGEALNEHILGDRWPPIELRQQMLAEAVQVMRELWTGENVDHHGEYFTVENARLFTCPDTPPAVVVSAFGDKAIALAAKIGDGLWGTSPQADIDSYVAQGGRGPKYGQLTLCWAASHEEAVDTAHRLWRNVGVPGQLAQELASPSYFEQAAELVTKQAVDDALPCGPDPDRVLESVREFERAGYDHIYFHQIGDDQEGFLRFYTEQLQPRL